MQNRLSLLKNKVIFLKEFIKSPSEVGAISSSSKYLANKISNCINYKDAKCIVEYGGGLGVFSNEIIKNMKDDTSLLIFENNISFYNKLLKNLEHSKRNDNKLYKNVYIINDSVEKIHHYCSIYNLSQVDYIVSGLPFRSFSQELTTRILELSQDILSSHGTFIAFQYSRKRLKLFNKYFENSQLYYEFRNIPPAFVYKGDNKSPN